MCVEYRSLVIFAKDFKVCSFLFLLLCYEIRDYELITQVCKDLLVLLI